MKDETEPHFSALMVGVKQIKDQHDHASRRSHAALCLDLRRNPDHVLAHLSHPQDVQISACQIDGARMKKLKAGKINLDGTLDLHGMTQEEARTELRYFIAEHVQRGSRCVLIITGKGEIGEGTPDIPKKGHIRRALPLWIKEKPLDYLVLQLVPAASHHGGTGAFYAALRKMPMGHEHKNNLRF